MDLFFKHVSREVAIQVIALDGPICHLTDCFTCSSACCNICPVKQPPPHCRNQKTNKQIHLLRLARIELETINPLILTEAIYLLFV